jgi:G3E family GTPase
MAIVVNELGEVGIDGEVLPQGMTRQVELPGGCICCVFNEELDTSLSELLDSTPDLELIVIETTGVAEPMPICWSLEREPLSERVRLAAVLTVIDVTNFEQSRALTPGVDAQVEYADVLLLSKTDLLDAPGSTMRALRELNAGAPIVTGTADDVVAMLWRFLTDPELPSTPRRRAPDPGHHHEDSGVLHAAHGFETVWLPIAGLLDFEELSAQLEELPANWVRIKGIAEVIDQSTGHAAPHWVVFHRVGTRVSSEPLPAPGSPRVVALGKGLERTRLAACLDASVIPSEG